MRGLAGNPLRCWFLLMLYGGALQAAVSWRTDAGAARAALAQPARESGGQAAGGEVRPDLSGNRAEEARNFSETVEVVPCALPSSSTLVGLWEERAADAPGLRSAWKFGADGSLLLAAFIVTGGTYRVEGDRLLRKQTEGPMGPRLKPSSWSVTGDTMIETTDEGTVVRRERIGARLPDTSPFVGAWQLQSPGGTLAWELISRDGVWELRRPMFRRSACYAVEGDRLRVTLPDGHAAPAAAFKIRGDDLTIVPGVPGEVTHHLKRQPGIAWYMVAEMGPQPLETLPAEEASDLLPRVRGSLVISGRSELTVIDLPTLTRRTLHVDSYFWGGWRFTAPDLNGRLSFFFARGLGERREYRSNFGGKQESELKRYTLVSIGLDGRGARELFSFDSPALYAVGPDVELSSRGRRTAYLRDVDYVHVRTGKLIEPVGVAKLRLFDTFWLERTLEREAIGILPGGGRLLAWHPDERRLAFAALADRTTVEAQRAELGEFARELFDDGWEKVPVVHLLDVESDRNIALGPGMDFFFSDDGRTLVVGDGENRWRTIDLATRVSTPLELPGNWRGPIALLENGLILYLANPTEGQPQKFSKAYSPLASPQALGTLKILDPATGRYQTLLPEAGSRVSYRFRAHS